MGRKYTGCSLTIATTRWKWKASKRDGDMMGFPVYPMEWKDPKTGDVSSGYESVGFLDASNQYALISRLAPSDNKEIFSMDELIQSFSLERVSKAAPSLIMKKLNGLINNIFFN